MPIQPVACVGDVTAVAGLVIPPVADAGSWTAGAITLTSYARLTVNARQVVSVAQCTFTGAFTKSGSPVTVTPSTVTLKASPTVLQGGLSNVLRNGDSASDTYGNTVKVTAAEILTSS